MGLKLFVIKCHNEKSLNLFDENILFLRNSRGGLKVNKGTREDSFTNSKSPYSL